MRMRLRKLLEEEGHQVIEAGDGEQAVEAYSTNKPDLELMDITMLNMDGLTALKTIKFQFHEAKVVMCSSLGQKCAVLEAIKTGVRDFIVNHFDAERVHEV